MHFMGKLVPDNGFINKTLEKASKILYTTVFFNEDR